MSSSQTLVEPGLRQHELECALRAVTKSTEGNSRGFMLAYSKSDGTFGFCFLVLEHAFSAAVYGNAPHRSTPFTFNSSYQPGYDREGGFTRGYFKSASEALGMGHADLVNRLAKKQTGWRFLGWAEGHYGGPWTETDNGATWQPLWGRLVEAAAHVPLGDMPLDHSHAVRRYLAAHANEGQVVLDR